MLREPNRTQAAYIGALVDELRSLALPEQVEAERVAAKRELSVLAASTVPFGRYANVPLSDVPRDYLHWLAAACEGTKNLLVEYLELSKREDE